MTTFRVWAPRRSQVELCLEGRFHAMERTANGWWATCGAAEPDEAYQYSLDGADVCPDPRSRFQPDGVRGASRLVDLASFRWSDRGFQSRPLSSALIYELHVGTFTPAGTFRAVIGQLDHLSRLGVTHVELMPVAEFAGIRGWGYEL